MVTFLRIILPPHINPFEIDAELVLMGLFADIALSNEPALLGALYCEDFDQGVVE